MEKVTHILSSWFHSRASTGALSNVEGQENAHIQHHKSAEVLSYVKGAVGTLFYNKFATSLAMKVRSQSDLIYGFACKWSQICEAVWDALGPNAQVKQLSGYMRKKEYFKGGRTVMETLHLITILEEVR